MSHLASTHLFCTCRLALQDWLESDVLHGNASSFSLSNQENWMTHPWGSLSPSFCLGSWQIDPPINSPDSPPQTSKQNVVVHTTERVRPIISAAWFKSDHGEPNCFKRGEKKTRCETMEKHQQLEDHLTVRVSVVKVGHQKWHPKLTWCLQCRDFCCFFPKDQSNNPVENEFLHVVSQELQ